MTSLSSTILALEEYAPLFAPPLVIAGIAALAFFMLGVVVHAFRDVANRHRNKTSNPMRGEGGHGAGH